MVRHRSAHTPGAACLFAAVLLGQSSLWRLEQEVRRRADEQAAVERERQERFQLDWAEYESRWRPPRDQYEALLNEHDAPWRPPTRAELHSQLDEIAKRVVAAGGGTQAVTDPTDLRTLKQVAALIDPAILTHAFDNDALAQTCGRSANGGADGLGKHGHTPSGCHCTNSPPKPNAAHTSTDESRGEATLGR